MGCATSKLEDLPAVSLCRERCSFLDEAIQHRFAFSEAHVAYLHSLKAVGISLDRFFNQDLEVSHSPVLNLPGQKKGDSNPPEPVGSPEKKIHHHIHSHSDSGHLNFHSDDDDSEDDDSGSESLNHDHHHEVNSPIHQSYGGYYSGFDYENQTGVYRSVNYMRNQVTPSVAYTQQQVRTETMQLGENFAASSSYNPYANYSENGNSYHNSHRDGPPPPPSPPRSSPWEFLNPFESFEKYYPAYPSSRDSREVREEEGIPDLEEEEFDEVVKELYVDQKIGTSGRSSVSKRGVPDEDGKRDAIDGHIQYKEARSDPVEYEVHMVDKNVVDVEARSKNQDNAPRRVFKGDVDVLKEIQAQFERASESESGLAEVLEIGKVRYKGKHGVSSKILHLPMMSPKRFSDADSSILDGDQELELRSKKLSSTLHKLYLWEKKLYEEVKAEEKMRLLHEQKSRRLKSLDEKGAENQKIHATRTMIRDLSAKIGIAIQVVDRISVKINSLRDDELWPQLLEFIQGLTKMWKSMLECHHSQCQAIIEAKGLDAISQRNNEAHFEATRQLEHDLINWTKMFSSWVSAQKGYVRALHNWLMKCLLYIPEETDDGQVPFSPSRIGAPPVFIVCFQWWQSLERTSEKEVIDRMRDFASNVLHLWDRDKAEMRLKMLASKDERKIRILDKEDQNIHRKIHALEKGIVVNSVDEGLGLTGNVVYQAETSKGGSLQAGLQHVLEALERFTGNSLKAYEELLQRIEEDNLALQHERIS